MADGILKDSTYPGYSFNNGSSMGGSSADQEQVKEQEAG